MIPILEALEAAHEAGIVHRDIKPANIVLDEIGDRQDSQPRPGEDQRPRERRSGRQPTKGAEPGDQNLTVPGTTMGTASYMSPEQARGHAIDARADLFSCGVVLYEMATGKRPFDGDGWAATVEAVINRRPRPARELNSDLPPEIEQVIDRGLEKDPAARYQTAADLRAELIRIKRSQEASHATASSVTSAPKRPVLHYAAVVVPVLIAAAGLVWYSGSAKGPITVPSEYTQLTNFSDYAAAPALSRDGRMVAFFRGGEIFPGTGQVYVKLLPDGESKQLTDDPNPKYDPVFTPDGSRVAFTTQILTAKTWETWTAPVLGGPMSRLLPNAAGLSWFGTDRTPQVLPSTSTRRFGNRTRWQISDRFHRRAPELRVYA